MTTASRAVTDDLDLLTKGCVDVIERDGLAEKLNRSRRDGSPLTVKVGFDPTAPDLHLGHTVLLRKMRQFQQLGHRVVFLIGDFTGRIGDPSGKKSSRPQLTGDEVAANAETYRRQVFRVLDPERTTVDFNARWLGSLSSEQWIRLAAEVTVAQMLEREDFRSRFEAHQPISVHELLYPLSQAYDSVALEADVELGGTDQLFNLLMGRQLMRQRGLEPQIVMTLPLLEGLDGVEKMSKSSGNYVAVEDPPNEMFGKLMSISDELMWRYQLLLTDRSEADIAARRRRVEDGDRHPMEEKKELAGEIVAGFHSTDVAAAARAEFERVFSSRSLPSEIPEVRLDSPGPTAPLAALLADCSLAASRSEARRLISQGAVKVDGEVVTDPRHEVATPPGTAILLQSGKRRFARVELS